ncbi:hypothetical protein PENTCL1PPCAC_29076 [Pristionchus entomophagus]|uniref:L-type lectin-like domain-containing protein n=1 Tax=Pristionchus entomophagus TaxID=358040 RepID=A0AAV5UJW5_9BILA|nr:hypothetical protein PENTCL1PPCAC_29076 [Pristionchus entomophagus]
MDRSLLLIACVLIASSIGVPDSAADILSNSLNGKSIHEFRGFYKREHSLIKPYQGAGMEIPNWDLNGGVMVTPHYVRLTPDEQSRQGAIWNRQPVHSRDWELSVSFKVSGATGDLFGDGFAIWYAQEPMQTGPVFGSKDYFRGLAVFLDTYSNHNGPHKHGHPYVSAMVADGSQHYDHDRDGTHTQLGGENTGCEAKFRNKDHDTNILIRYVGDTLSLFIDVEGKMEWKECMKVDNVHLPTGYYLGMSATTGELSDAHDIISVKMFEQEFSRVERLDEINSDRIVPHAEFQATPRDHSDDPKPSKLGFVGTVILVLIGVVVVVGVLGYGVLYFKNKNERQRKRFY